jgi:DNA polymerase-3 subunit epsilon
MGPLVAHNAAFDMSCLRQTLEELAGDAPHFDYVCTAELASELMPDLPDAKLATVAQALQIPFTHHHAASDAITSAKVLIELTKRHGITDLTAYLRRTERPGLSEDWEFSGAAVSLSVENVRATRAGYEHGGSLQGDLEGKNVVITGALGQMSRDEAKTLVKNAGGEAKGSVSRKTHVVIVGNALWNGYLRTGHTTGKLERAFEIQQEGQDIEIWTEDDFYRFVDSRSPD